MRESGNTNFVLATVQDWINQHSAKNGIPSRNTVAVGIVVLDHLVQKCPVEKSEIQSNRGEIRGARIPGLAPILEKYGVPSTYLKEVTTRAGHQDGQKLFEALNYGQSLSKLSAQQRQDYLLEAIQALTTQAHVWLNRQHLKIACDRQLSPSTWIASILGEAKGRSGGKVEQHLVGAKLEQAHPGVNVPNNPGHAGDAQTGRPADFLIGTTAYHVTASPGSTVIRKCVNNIGEGLHPVLLVPQREVFKAQHLAEDIGHAERITIMAIEPFIALNIIELSKGQQNEFISILKSIVDKYNRRLCEVESDMSLQIELA